MMKFSLPLVLALIAVLVLPDHESSAFAPAQVSNSVQTASSTTTSLSMGLFDMFSKEAQEERERKKRKAIEEQERLQKEIMDRRRNPEKMEEYEIKTQMRRELRMEGKDEEAAKIASTLYEGAKNQSLLNGAKPSEQ
uniref:Uncharacterized protein n=1 Tax=Pseudo-nitzschia delicatissima TaxID=44447 RepID=A0A7S0Y920_9STRA|mmetsp:Transcript_959/g.1944  ORF Transcript_959/g.1944 Transcript_959/m.1944 type:complete len:137 (+) Transcript_959:117-527(+)